MTKKAVFYMHAGSYNHGCEAIVRSTVGLFSDLPVILESSNKNEDTEYGLDNICEVNQIAPRVPKKTVPYILSRIAAKFFGFQYPYKKIVYARFLKSVSKENLYFSIGGDNYCYDSKIKSCLLLNREITARGGKTVLWGVSIEPEIINNPKIKNDLAKYSLIVARESITKEALLGAGLNNVAYCPDPAFCLNKKDGVKREFRNDIVGINISPMALDYSADGNTVRKAYIKMINHILDTTDYSVYLIPHVIWNGGDDRVVLEDLYNEIKDKDRVFKVPDSDCETLKAYISHCRFFVGARTHSTIAAYSLCIPTLVVGYSVKARGIAKDLFGSWENYVKPVQYIKSDNDLTVNFEFLEQNEEFIKNTLKEKLETYPEYYKKITNEIKNLI